MGVFGPGLPELTDCPRPRLPAICCIIQQKLVHEWRRLWSCTQDRGQVRIGSRDIVRCYLPAVWLVSLQVISRLSIDLILAARSPKRDPSRHDMVHPSSMFSQIEKKKKYMTSSGGLAEEQPLPRNTMSRVSFKLIRGDRRDISWGQALTLQLHLPGNCIRGTLHQRGLFREQDAISLQILVRCQMYSCVWRNIRNIPVSTSQLATCEREFTIPGFGERACPVPYTRGGQ